MNILIVKLSAIGDVIHTLPAVNALRRRYPEAHIAWLVEEASAGLLIGHESLDELLICPRKRWIKELAHSRGISVRKKVFREIYQFIRKLRDRRYDVILDFQALLKSSVWIALARGRRKIGFGRGMEHMEKSYIFLNEKLPPVDMEIHALVRNLMMVKPFGVVSENIEYLVPVSDSDRLQASRLLNANGLGGQKPVAAINPVAKWDTKLWEFPRFRELADRLVAEYDFRIVFTGAKQDRELIQSIIEGMENRSAAVNLAGKTALKSLAAVYKLARILVTTDTGPMHLAAALNTPVVAIFGPTAPWRTGPFGAGHLVITAGADCAPCFKRTCKHKTCMQNIQVEDVWEGIQMMLGERHNPG